MRSLLLVAGTIAAVAFVFGAIGSLFATHASWNMKFMIALMPAGFAFSAALILGARDHVKATITMRTVRKLLLARVDVQGADFLACFPNVDPTLLTQTRTAIAQFFDVPVEKIHPTDELRRDLRFDVFQFGPFVVACNVLSARDIYPRRITLRTDVIGDAGALAGEIERMLKEDSGPSERSTILRTDRE